MQMEAGDVTHPKEEKDKNHAEEAKPTKEKKEKVGEATDAAKLRVKLEKIDAKIDDLKAKKQEIVTRLLELKGTAATAAAETPASG